MMGQLDGKVAVVTGGTRGLGFGIARAFVQAGAAVVVASRSQTAVDEAVRRLREAGEQADGMALDVADLAQMEALAGLAVSKFGRLDVWVNNAGVAGPYGPTLDFNSRIFKQVVDTNILGVYYGSRVAMNHFIANRSGKLINMLGRGYQSPVPWQNGYAASKAWVRSFTKALAQETHDSGVGVFALNPGMVLTDLLTDVDVVEGYDHLLKSFPTVVRMWAKSPEVPAQKAVWIASAATDGKTGKEYNVLTPGVLLGGAVKEGFRKLFGPKLEDPGITIRIIQPDHH
jgi:NAD(P)-dependent dehydrogenase (short-subunit alcohol dehydrogenase family)